MYEVKVSIPCYKQTNKDKKAAVNVGTAAQKMSSYHMSSY